MLVVHFVPCDTTGSAITEGVAEAPSSMRAGNSLAGESEAGAALVVLCVRSPFAAGGTGPGDASVRRTELARIAARHGGRLLSRDDAPARAITAVAVELAVDLIVMAAPRARPFARALVSNAVVRTLRHAPCDVLVVSSAMRSGALAPPIEARTPPAEP